MEKPAARLSDKHSCPMVTPALVPIPHVGSVILGPGTPTVLIGGKPAATMGDVCLCVGPPDIIIMGSMSVIIGGKPAAMLGSATAHGGTITSGCPTVLIGNLSKSQQAFILGLEHAIAAPGIAAYKAAVAIALAMAKALQNFNKQIGHLAHDLGKEFQKSTSDLGHAVSNNPAVKEAGSIINKANQSLKDLYSPEKGML